MTKLSLVLFSLAACWADAQAVTVYGQQGMTVPSGVATTAASTATADSLDWLSNFDAYNTVSLTAPSLPSPVPTAFSMTVQNSASTIQGLGTKQEGNFLGFSIEMSVVQQVSEYLPLESRANNSI